MTWPGMTGDAFNAAFEWNLGRTWHLRSRQAVPSPMQARVLAVLQGLWVAGSGARGCNPLRGQHRSGCDHEQNLVPIRFGHLAEALFAQSGGSQIRQLRRAIADLAELEVRFRLYRPKELVIAKGPLISLVPATADLMDQLGQDGVDRMPNEVVRFADGLVEGLLAGHYQRIPNGLVQGLANADYLLWQVALCQVPVGRARATGKVVTLSMTGRNPAIHPWQIGRGSLPRQRLMEAVENAAEHGNALQREFVMAQVELDPLKGRVKTRVGIQIVARLKSKNTAARPAADGMSGAVLRQPDPEMATGRDMNKTFGLDEPTSSATYDSWSGAVGPGAGLWRLRVPGEPETWTDAGTA